MLFVWPCILISIAAAHRVVESVEEEDPGANTTTLYPVSSTNTSNSTNSAGTKLKSATSWKIETAFGEPKHDFNSTSIIDSKEAAAVDRPANSSEEFRPSPHLGSFIDEDSFGIVPTRATDAFSPVIKKPPIGFHSSSSVDSKEATEVDQPEISSQEFRPSPHLGSFIDEDSFGIVPTRATDAFSPVMKQPPVGFYSSFKDDFKSFNKIPEELFKKYQGFPYKLEQPILTRVKDDWKPTAGSSVGNNRENSSSSGLESKPTVEAPVRIPAGGLYKSPDPFKVKPGTTDEDFGLEFSSGGKQQSLGKRVNPWKNLLHLLTALIPVGIIFSALTPNVITIEPDAPVGSHIFRRADGSFASVPQISERCRRRLLCELHSETNYPSRSRRRGKKCHRLECEDPAALAQTLEWLLSHHKPSDKTEDDQFTIA